MKVLVGVAAAEQRERIAALFAKHGHTSMTADSRAATLEIASSQALDLLVLDGSDADFDGHGLLDRIRLSKPAMPILLLTSPGDVDARVQFNLLLRKPVARGGRP